MPRGLRQLDREINEALLRQKGQRAYYKAHARIGDSSDARLGPEGARQAAMKISSRPEGQAIVMEGWLSAHGEHLQERTHYDQRRQDKTEQLEHQGARAYNAAHTRIGNSTDIRLGASGARRAARKISGVPDDQEAFMKGWLDENDRHLLVRSSYGKYPHVPLHLELPLSEED